MSTSSPKRPRLVKADYERLSNFRYRLRRFLHVSEEICKAEGLTPLQYQLLLHVRGFPERDWASIGELAERLQAQHHGVVALIDRCEKLGLVARQPGREDRRVVEIHLLPPGELVLERIAGLHRNELQQLLEGFRQTRA
ncbi:MAG: MarR family transcriptional regulator [Thiobacillaceae bacterium]|jgi:DNA-binding MarR family transcriptional regulator|nr:MarR family transcriptional regulator [Thiobacillaceae bacterium]